MSTEEITVQGGATLHVHVHAAENTGARPTLVLLHGWPNAGRVWDSLIEFVSLGQPFSFVALDLRGFGDSDKTPTGYTCAGFADDVLDVIAALKLSRYVLVGHSMGGKIAQLVAARRPAGLSGLVLVAPVPLVAAEPTPPDKKATQKAAYGNRDATAAVVLGLAARPLPGALQTLLIEDGLRAAPAAWNGWIEPMRDEDFSGEAVQIAVPTLVIAPEKDPLRAPDDLKRDIVDRVPGALLARLPGAGHLPHVEDPTALAALLVNFLDGLPQG